MGAVAAGVGAAVAGAAVTTVGNKLLNGSGSGSGGSSSTQQSSGPWAPQAAQLQNAYTGAQGIYDARNAAGPYTGNFVAGTNSVQQDGLAQAANWANGTGGTIPEHVATASEGLLGASSPYVANASSIAANGTPAPNAAVMNNLNSYAAGNGMAGVQNVNAGLSSALNSAATQGANAIGGFNSGLNGIMNSAQGDSTQGLISDAGQYASSAPTQAAINNVNSQISQTLNEQTNPSFNRTAAAGGNLNSSRAGMGEAMNNENAAIAMGNADSQISNNAYNTGLATAASQHTAGLNTALSAAEGGLSGNTALAQGNQNTQLATQLGEANSQNTAAATALGQQTNANALNANTKLSANAQLGTAAGLGINGLASAGNDATSNYGLTAAAGGVQQANENNVLNNQYQQWSMGNTYDQNVLNSYMGIVGSGNYGGSSSAQQQSTLPNNLGNNLVGGAAAGAGLYQNLTGGNNTNSPTGSNVNGGNGSGTAYGLVGGNGAAGILGTTQGLYSAYQQPSNYTYDPSQVASNGLMGQA